MSETQSPWVLPLVVWSEDLREVSVERMSAIPTGEAALEYLWYRSSYPCPENAEYEVVGTRYYRQKGRLWYESTGQVKSAVRVWDIAVKLPVTGPPAPYVPLEEASRWRPYACD